MHIIFDLCKIETVLEMSCRQVKIFLDKQNVIYVAFDLQKKK